MPKHPGRTGRPLVEGEARTVNIKVWVTTTLVNRIDAVRGDTPRSAWVREQIEKGLTDEQD